MKTITTGTVSFTEAQKNLDLAIREYDQAVLHLAARTVACISQQYTFLTFSSSISAGDQSKRD